MRIVNIVGARPNFMKMAPLLREMRRYPDIVSTLVHTGQHYDDAMAGQFFRDLDLPTPDISLEVGSGSHAVQTAEVMKRLEPVLKEIQPHLVLVVGDVNSTVAAAITSVKMGIAVAHVEAGLRSFDRTMPEEINRLLTDAISDYLFVTEESGCENLLREGVDKARIHMVGNVMIDSLDQSRAVWERSDVITRLGVSRGALWGRDAPPALECRRPRDAAGSGQGAVGDRAPRSSRVPGASADPDSPGGDGGRDRVPAAGGARYVAPLGYLDFLALVAGARIVLTDSGGLQEETTALGVPCLTLRENTERPVTVARGTNRIVGTSPDRIVPEAMRVLSEGRPAVSRPPMWDGRAAERIVAIIRQAAG